MTAIATRPLSDSTDSLLRFALRLDATLTGLLGLGIAAMADPMARLTGLTAVQGYIVGAAFVLYGLGVYALAALPDVRRLGIALAVFNTVGTVGFIAVATIGGVAADFGRCGRDVGLLGVHRGVRRPAVPRSAPSGVTPAPPVWGRRRFSRGGSPHRLSITNREGKIHDHVVHCHTFGLAAAAGHAGRRRAVRAGRHRADRGRRAAVRVHRTAEGRRVRHRRRFRRLRDGGVPGRRAGAGAPGRHRHRDRQPVVHRRLPSWSCWSGPST